MCWRRAWAVTSREDRTQLYAATHVNGSASVVRGFCPPHALGERRVFQELLLQYSVEPALLLSTLVDLE